MIDAVLSRHLNAQTCGVAKFSQQLADHLRVPFGSCYDDRYSHPLLSLKFAEIRPEPVLIPRGRWDVFLHDTPCMGSEWDVVLRADRCFAGNGVVASSVRAVRPDVIEAFCPAMVSGDPSRGSYRVLVFGFAHKLVLPHFEALKQQLEIEHPDYTIELSTAVHEGNPWDEAFAESHRAMFGIFGERLRTLGYLADDALARVLTEVDAVAAFYVPALRANNTTYWAAVEAGKPVYTNRDEFSPKEGDPPATWERLLELIA